jgi:ABC-2 type transport system ATP-binding protein
VGFNPELTGRENVYLNGALLGFSEKEVAAMYDGIVEFAELEAFMDQKLKNYSSGMQVRLAFSMATRSQADILLIDEVLAVGDADFQRKCFQYFEQLKRDKRTVVFVSHDMNAIQQYCDRAVLINENKSFMTGSPLDVGNRYSQMFISERSPSSNSKNGGKRWGDGKIVFSDVACGLVSDKQTMHITAKLESTMTVRNAKIGFNVKNYSGTVLFGTNTTLENAEVPELKPNEKHTIVWEVPNILNEGRYDVDMSVSYEGIVADWWQDACEIEILKATKTPYLVYPNAKFSISQKN